MNNVRYWQSGMTLAETEKMIIEYEYLRQGKNRELTAKSLGIAPRTVSNKISQYKKDAEELLEKKNPSTNREEMMKASYAKQKAATS